MLSLKSAPFTCSSHSYILLYISRLSDSLVSVAHENVLEVNLCCFGTYPNCNFVPYRKEGNVSYNCSIGIFKDDHGLPWNEKIDQDQ